MLLLLFDGLMPTKFLLVVDVATMLATLYVAVGTIVFTLAIALLDDVTSVDRPTDDDLVPISTGTVCAGFRITCGVAFVGLISSLLVDFTEGTPSTFLTLFDITFAVS